MLDILAARKADLRLQLLHHWDHASPAEASGRGLLHSPCMSPSYTQQKLTRPLLQNVLAKPQGNLAIKARVVNANLISGSWAPLTFPWNTSKHFFCALISKKATTTWALVQTQGLQTVETRIFTSHNLPSNTVLAQRCGKGLSSFAYQLLTRYPARDKSMIKFTPLLKWCQLFALHTTYLYRF